MQVLFWYDTLIPFGHTAHFEADKSKYPAGPPQFRHIPPASKGVSGGHCHLPVLGFLTINEPIGQSTHFLLTLSQNPGQGTHSPF